MFKDSAIFRRGEISRSCGTTLWLAGIAIFSALALSRVPLKLLSVDFVPVFVVALLFALLLLLGLGSVVARNGDAIAVVRRLAFLIWWFVLICEVVFDHTGSGVESSQGNFSVEAYGEAGMWVLAFGAVVVIALQQRTFLRQLFSGPYKWVAILALVSVASCVLSPGKMYSLGWAFKLVLVVLMLQLSASTMFDVEDILAFLKVTLWAFLILALVPATIAFSDPATAFEGVGGRLNAGPDALTLTAASLMLLSTILYSIEKRVTYIIVGLIGTVVMILSLGKTGNIAGIFSAMLFLALQKKVMRSLGLLLGIAGVGFIIISVTPVADHLQSYQGASTLTGRTAIWAAGIQGIKQSPIWGHGYLASYFSFEKSSELLNGANNLHNGFLEVTYNNGIIGLALIIVIHILIVRGIFRSLRVTSYLRERMPGDRRVAMAHLLTVGVLAIYANLFINGLFNTAFGGRAHSAYMLFLAVFFIVQALQKCTTDLLNSLPSRKGVWRAELQLVPTS
ncbi:MAG: O-antigen ligase family protein [Terriglobales bacterium]